MRNRKFRAWDKDAERMIYSDQQYDLYYFEFDGGKLKAFTIHESPGTIDEPPQSYSTELDNLMDYIGLKDKNGKPVYEGDALKASHPNIGLCKGTVEYDEELAAYGLNRGPQGCDEYLAWNYLFEFDELEIIGNLWENKELIDENQ